MRFKNITKKPTTPPLEILNFNTHGLIPLYTEFYHRKERINQHMENNKESKMPKTLLQHSELGEENSETTIKQFSDLTIAEVEALEKQQYERAKKQNRELINDVRGVWEDGSITDSDIEDSHKELKDLKYYKDQWQKIGGAANLQKLVDDNKKLKETVEYYAYKAFNPIGDTLEDFVNEKGYLDGKVSRNDREWSGKNQVGGLLARKVLKEIL